MVKKGIITSVEIVNHKLSFYGLEFDKQIFKDAVKRKRNIWGGLSQLLNRVPDFNDITEEINRMEFLKGKRI